MEWGVHGGMGHRLVYYRFKDIWFLFGFSLVFEIFLASAITCYHDDGGCVRDSTDLDATE
jgi:hypothetical protein